MIKLFFLDVGQGDSIVVQWESKGLVKTGIIDCKQGKDKIPTIEKLKELEVNELEFIILSHPHSDHYSGMLLLLKYCKSENISINYFLHTCPQSPDYLRSAEISQENRKKLRKFFTFLRTQRSDMKYKEYWLNADAPKNSIDLNDDIELIFLSPSTKEYEDYLKNALPQIISEEHSGANPNANYLSTILKIIHKTKMWYILLTSDAEARSFKRLKSDIQAFSDKDVLLIGQSPHHGSKRNFHTNFWKSRKIIEGKSMAAISVGQNKYGHPSKEVIQKLREEGFVVRSTNSSPTLIIHSSPPSISEAEAALNIFSIVHSLPSSNDIVVEIDKLGNLSYN